MKLLRIHHSFKFLALFAFILIGNVSAQDVRCVTDIVHQHKLLHDHAYRLRYDEINNTVPLFSQSRVSSIDTTLIIPVVVHVLYNTAEQNLSEEQIQSQIDILNEDYAVLNANSLDIPGVWTNLQKDSKIRFQLAQRDPFGNNTTGITRTSTPKQEFEILDPDIYETDSGGYDAWPNVKYLNMWVCKLQSNALGFANFPGSSANQDGVVISYKAFGRNGTVTSPYDFGRTSTHEIGHWLSLLHIWGDDNDNCIGKDFPPTQQTWDDTPNQAKPTFRCPTFPKLDDCSATSPGIMYMNYMDYTDDKCMMFFTPGQIRRMRTIVDGIRDTLKSSDGNILPSFYSNDAAIDSVLNPVRLANSKCLDPVVRLKNNGNDTLKTVLFSYGIYQGLQKYFRWNGSLLPGQSEIIALETIGVNFGNQVMEFRIMGTDDNTVNNYRSSGFKVNAAATSNCSNSGLIAFPNPVGTQHSVSVQYLKNVSQDAVVRLINMLGQVVSERVLTVNPGDIIPFDLSSYSGGVYLVNIEGDAANESVKFIYIPDSNSGNNP